MDLTQIITISGIAFVVAAAIATYLLNKKKIDTLTQLPNSAAITKDVLDQIVKKAKILPEDVTIDLGQLPYSASKPIDEELVIKATGTDEFYVPIENSTKPKKKRKYYPKKPKTQL